MNKPCIISFFPMAPVDVFFSGVIRSYTQARPGRHKIHKMIRYCSRTERSPSRSTQSLTVGIQRLKIGHLGSGW